MGTKPKKLNSIEIGGVMMKNSILAGLFVVLFTIAAIPAAAQTRTRFALISFDETKSQIEALPTFLNQYKTLRSVLPGCIRAVNDAVANRDDSMLASALGELQFSYARIVTHRISRNDLWAVLFALSENPGVLSRSGWSEDEIEKAKSWKGVFKETSNKIRKIDAQFPTDNQVEQILRNSNLDVMFLLFAGLPSPAFIL